MRYPYSNTAPNDGATPMAQSSSSLLFLRVRGCVGEWAGGLPIDNEVSGSVFLYSTVKLAPLSAVPLPFLVSKWT